MLCSIAAPKKPRANSSAHEASEAHEDVDSVDEQPSFDDTDLDLAFFLNDVKSSDDEERPSSSGTSSPSAGRRSIVSPTDSIEELSAQLEASLEDMIQTAQMHPRSLQVGQSSLSFAFLSFPRNSPTSFSLSCSIAIRADSVRSKLTAPSFEGYCTLTQCCVDFLARCFRRTQSEGHESTKRPSKASFA